MVRVMEENEDARVKALYEEEEKRGKLSQRRERLNKKRWKGEREKESFRLII